MGLTGLREQAIVDAVGAFEAMRSAANRSDSACGGDKDPVVLEALNPTRDGCANVHDWRGYRGSSWFRCN